MNATPMIPPFTSAKVTKGCRELLITKGETARVTNMRLLDRKEVALTLYFERLGKYKTLYARHINRLSDDEIRLNTGMPHQVVIISKVA